ncbi:MAG: hypothetical protein QG621_294 [Patescibacteria group bacterium]|jgi:hypothetical protein|nr:hypothetical protein [Patescibacteria group bacterium]
MLKKLLVAALLCASVVLTPMSDALSLDRKVWIYNQSSYDVYEMYVSNVGKDKWGPDQFGPSGILHRNYRTLWNIDDGSGYCRFDFKFVLSDGSARYKRDYNVCEFGRLNVVD